MPSAVPGTNILNQRVWRSIARSAPVFGRIGGGGNEASAGPTLPQTSVDQRVDGCVGKWSASTPFFSLRACADCCSSEGFLAPSAVLKREVPQHADWMTIDWSGKVPARCYCRYTYLDRYVLCLCLTAPSGRVPTVFFSVWDCLASQTSPGREGSYAYPFSTSDESDRNPSNRAETILYFPGPAAENEGE